MIKKILAYGALATLLITGKANAQDWHNLTFTYNLSEQRQVLRLQRGDKVSYGFLDLFGKGADFETIYGEFRLRKNLGKGFGFGLEYNGGTDVKDLVRPHIAYTTELGPVFLDVKFSPLESTLKQGQQLGLYCSVKLPLGLGLESWHDFDYKDKRIAHMGEVELSKNINKKLSMVGRAEKYPWQEKIQYSLGGKLVF